MRRSRFFLNSSIGDVMAAGRPIEHGSVPFMLETIRDDEKLNPNFLAA